MKWLAWLLALGLVACGGAGSGGGGTAGAAGSSSGGTGGAATGGSGGTVQVGGNSGTGATGGTSPGCDADLAGSYFLALAMKVDPQRPLVFLVTLAVTGQNGAPVTTWTLQPLDASDRQTPVGSPIVWPAIEHAVNGTFISDPPPMDLPSEANPFTQSPMTLDIVDFAGSLCSGAASCGTFGGETTSPLQLSLAGSTWATTAIGGNGYPEPPTVDCNGTLAAPVSGG